MARQIPSTVSEMCVKSKIWSPPLIWTGFPASMFLTNRGTTLDSKSNQLPYTLENLRTMAGTPALSEYDLTILSPRSLAFP